MEDPLLSGRVPMQQSNRNQVPSSNPFLAAPVPMLRRLFERCDRRAQALRPICPRSVSPTRDAEDQIAVGISDIAVG